MPNVERNLFRYPLPNGNERNGIYSVLHKFTVPEGRKDVATGVSLWIDLLANL